MKVIFALCGLILITGGVLLWRSMQEPLIYGEFVHAPHAEVANLIRQPQDYLGKTVSIEGTITNQCQSMGCYFFFTEGGKDLRVELADIAMNAPKKRDGHRARVEGRIVPYDKGYQFLASAVEFL